MTTGLIPWTTAGIFYTATLGVPTLDYAPYTLLNLLNPLVSIGMAVMGVGLLRSGHYQNNLKIWKRTGRPEIGRIDE